MSSRKGGMARCGVCGLHLPLCICALAPRLPTRTRVVLLMQQRETFRPSNTGRLAHLCLTNSEIIRRGCRDAPPATVVLPRNARPAVLFPAADAIPLDQWPGGKPDYLLVPDGTWSQASRMRHRIAGLENIRCVSLPETGERLRQLRTADRASRVCTLAAVARALGLLEAPVIREELLRVLQLMVERALLMKGRGGRMDAH